MFISNPSKGIKLMAKEEVKISEEESFRSSLEDVVVICERLSSVCNSLDDLIEMCKLATSNDSQLRLIMSSLKPTSPTKKGI